jgi:dolichol-phosphate mannosyltransferase
LKKSLVIIPTYNEADNIAEIIHTIFELDGGFHILIVDDNSSDGTGDIIDNLLSKAEFSDRFFALKRTGKLGLGTAYIEGFQWGIDRHYELLFQMDADFSHDPSLLPQFAGLLDEHDVVCGSRYVDGGGCANWNWARQLLSRAGSIYSRSILRLPLRDLTGGFNGWRMDCLVAIDLATVQSEGYAFQIELKYRSWRRGFRLHEAPIIFNERRAGQSKMSGYIVLEAIRRVWTIKKFR